jgi:hypothetical protein
MKTNTDNNSENGQESPSETVVETARDAREIERLTAENEQLKATIRLTGR